MLLDGKVAVVYGAGAIGGAMARAFGAEGARVFVVDRTGATAEALAAEIVGAAASRWRCTRWRRCGDSTRASSAARVAAFVASDKARTMTAATVNVGALIDQGRAT